MFENEKPEDIKRCYTGVGGLGKFSQRYCSLIYPGIRIYCLSLWVNEKNEYIIMSAIPKREIIPSTKITYWVYLIYNGKSICEWDSTRLCNMNVNLKMTMKVNKNLKVTMKMNRNMKVNMNRNMKMNMNRKINMNVNVKRNRKLKQKLK